MAQPRTAKRERPKNAKGTLLRILKYSFPSTASFFGLMLLVFAGNGAFSMARECRIENGREALSYVSGAAGSTDTLREAQYEWVALPVDDMQR